jgi:hypothetical protein
VGASSDIFGTRGPRGGLRIVRSDEDSLAAPPIERRAVEEPLVEELADRLSDRLADRVVDLLFERVASRLQLSAAGGSNGLVDAREIARRTGRPRWWVYEHAADLGAVRLGSGSRPRLAFSPARAEQYLRRKASER